MANNFEIKNRSEMIERQTEYLFNKMYEKLGDTVSAPELAILVSDTIRRYYVNLGRPLLVKRPADPDHLPFLEEHNEMVDEMAADISILFDEVKKIGDGLSDHFNYAQSERLRIENRIRGISSLVNDLNLIANESYGNTIYFKDSFTDYDKIEESMIMGTPVKISTREGIVTLARTDASNVSNTASIKLLQGDGEKGTAHLAKKINVETVDGQFSIQASYISDQTPNNDPSVVLDGRPDTVFEYQMVGLSINDIVNTGKGYDFDWVKGKQFNDVLRLKLVIELDKVKDINWLNLNPYHPPGSTGKVTVYSIRTSEDGFDYKPLYSDGNYVINAELNTTPQTYRADDVFNMKNDFSASKFAGQGVWSFGTRKAKYVEIVLDQNESYESLVGHTYYEKVTVVKDPNTGVDKETSIRIPSSDAPENILTGAPGKYPLVNQEYIRKSIETFKGWRYAIGLRDVNIMSYEFAEKSEFVSKRFTLKKPIKEILLYANEKIPVEFLSDIVKSNDWIQYYISIDDINWHRISPMHQQPMNPEEFAPKIYEINKTNNDLQTSFKLHKGYIQSDKEVNGVRLKVVMQRPTALESAMSFTPILEDYSLRVVFEDDAK